MGETKRLAVASLAALPPGTCRSVETECGWIALYNVDGVIYATDDTCPHAGGPLGEGILSGDCIACPWHGWRFNVETGVRVENAAFTVECFPTQIEGDQILVEIPLQRKSF
ncbi:MAG: Rieske 2Fe-2S domain-containing protein [Nitrospiraceae bacterium]